MSTLIRLDFGLTKVSKQLVGLLYSFVVCNIKGKAAAKNIKDAI